MSTHLSPAALDERDRYPLHEEDDVPETAFHERQVRYLRYALAARLSGWFVTGDVCIYWEEGNYALYVAPDVFVVRGPLPVPDPRVYLTWQDPPVIFVAEIGSRSTFRADEGPKLEVYARHIDAAEYLYADPLQGDVRLWRLGPEGYEAVAAEPSGRLRSAQLDLEFGLDEPSFLRIYTLDGEALWTYEEASLQVAGETQRRREAEARAAGEARRRRAAEKRAAEETARRQELERRLAELQAQLPEQEA